MVTQRRCCRGRHSTGQSGDSGEEMDSVHGMTTYVTTLAEQAYGVASVDIATPFLLAVSCRWLGLPGAWQTGNASHELRICGGKMMTPKCYLDC